MKKSRKITRIELLPIDHGDVTIIGIVSSDPHYKLSLRLNRKLNINLRSNTPVVIPGSDGSENFTRFSDSTADSGHVFHLISNRSDKNFLIKKLRNIDYLLVIPELRIHFEKATMIAGIRELDTITAVFDIDHKSLNDRNFIYVI
ncbi:MAG: IPExxxVDY family protein [Bacteroidales bacterium]